MIEPGQLSRQANDLTAPIGGRCERRQKQPARHHGATGRSLKSQFEMLWLTYEQLVRHHDHHAFLGEQLQPPQRTKDRLCPQRVYREQDG